MSPDPAPQDAMWADIGRQPQELARLLRRSAELRDFAERYLRPGTSGCLHAFGSGDGWFAARSAWPRNPTCRREVWSGLEFLLGPATGLTAADRALAVSMSGNVDRTVEGARAALSAGAGLAILTNTGGRLAELGTPAFRLDIQDVAPFLCGTTSFTATLIALWLMCLPCGRQADAAAATALGAAIERIPDLIGEADDGVRSLVARVSPTLRGVRFLAPGRQLPIADYGAAKLVELTRVLAWSDELEEFAHRQYWSMSADELVVLVPADAAGAAFAEATAAALAELPAQTLVLEPQGCAVPSATFRIATGGTGIGASVMQAVALQIFAYRLALATGTDPNRRDHLKQDAARFRVSRLLTRRSLVGTNG